MVVTKRMGKWGRREGVFSVVLVVVMLVDSGSWSRVVVAV